jgi:dihydroorotase
MTGSLRAPAGRLNDGVTVTGWPVGTFVRGTRMMWEGELAKPAPGEAVRFLETLAGG